MRLRFAWLLCGALAALPASAQTILGVLGGGGIGTDDAGAVVTIDATTGAATVLGTPIPGESLTGVARLDDGRVVASTALFTGASRLIEIDPATGALVQEIGAFTDGQVARTMHDLATGADGQLYGISVGEQDRPDGIAGGGPGDVNAVFRIDPATAACTYVGTPLVSGDYMAVAFHASGGLYSVQANIPVLERIDVATGEHVGVPLPIVGSGNDGALGLGLLTGGPNPELIMSSCCEGGTGNAIYRVDAITAAATLLGSAGGNRRVHDLVVLADLGPGPGTVVVEVPALGREGIFALALLLAAAGAALLWRR